MTTSFSHSTDRASQERRPEQHDQHQTAERVLQQISHEERRAVNNRQTAERMLDSGNTALPHLQIVINEEHIDHRNVQARNLDTNRDGVVSRYEAQAHVVAGSTRDTRRMAVGVAANFDAIAGLNPADGRDSASEGDFARLRSLPANDPLARRVDASMDAAFTHARNEGLFDRTRGVVPEAVQQGALNNSPLMATFASMAETRIGQQVLLQTMQHPGGANDPGMIFVHFGNGQILPTSAPRQSEPFGVFARDTGHGTWPNFMERSVGIQRQLNGTGAGDAANEHAATENASQSEIFNLMTPSRYSRVHQPLANVTDDALHSRLLQVSRGPVAMVANTVAHPTGTTTVKDAHGRDIPGNALEPHQSYSVSRYDSASRTIYLRNPRNTSQLQSMPLSQFRRNFANFDAVYE